MEDRLTLTGRIKRQTYSTGRLLEQFNNWDELSEQEKYNKLQTVTADDVETVYNVTTNNFHEYLVDNLDPGQTKSLNATWVALGTDSSTGTSSDDTSLNNEVFTKKITDHSDNGNVLLASTFVSSSEANGSTLNEIGLYTGDPENSDTDDDIFLINHATFSDVRKDSDNTITFDVTLTFSDK